jgi:F420-non-reducing hydrogenase iron-sulfur subunit
MTVKRIDFMKKLLEFSGIDPERLNLKWVSSAEGPRFAQVVTDFVEKIRALGPSPLRRPLAEENWDSLSSVQA